MVLALPLYDGLGRRVGSRGICRDISVQRLRDGIPSRSRMRDRVVSYIVDTFRAKERPQDMLHTAVASIGLALEAQGCDIFIRTSDGELSHADGFGLASGEHNWSQGVLDHIEDETRFEGELGARRDLSVDAIAAVAEVVEDKLGLKQGQAETKRSDGSFAARRVRRMMEQGELSEQ